MSQTKHRIEQLEEEVRALKAQLESEREERKNVALMKDELENHSHWQTILIKVLHIMQSAENMSQAMTGMLAETGRFTGVSRVYCLEKNADETIISCTYDWSNTGISRISDSFQSRPVNDFQPWFDLFNAGEIINTPDINTLIPQMFEIVNRFDVKSYLVFPLTDNGVDYGLVGFHDCVANRVWSENEVKLLDSLAQIISATRNRFRSEQQLITDNNRLTKYHDELEFAVKERTEELAVAYEELQANNEELQATSEELFKYQTQLEKIVADKTIELIARQDDLEKLSSSQAVLINVLKIVQSADDLPQAMRHALAEIGKYAGVSRIHAFEKNACGTTVSCFMDWCNDGLETIIEILQNVPVETVQAFIHMSETGEYVIASDSKMLAPELVRMLAITGVKTVAVFPLSSGSVNYGFVVFDECACSRKWDDNELELLKNLSQIISTARNRLKAEEDLFIERDRLKSIGDNFPNGALFCFEIDVVTNDMRLSYLSGTWEKVMGIGIEETMADFSTVFSALLPQYGPILLDEIQKSVAAFKQFFIEVEYYKDGGSGWLQISSHPQKISGNVIKYDGFILDITARKNAEQELIMERDRLKAIGDNFPDGSLFRFEINPLNTTEMSLSYMSATWEEVMGTDVEETMADISKWFDAILPEYQAPISDEIVRCTSSLEHFTFEYQIRYKEVGTKWILASSHPKKISDDLIVFDGFVLDITARKNTEIELAKHQEELESLVKERTEELQLAYEEMQSTNEELCATSEELYKNQTQLEDIVAEKTAEVIARQEELKKLNNLQEVFIKVMQILQFESDVTKGMNQSLDIIGNYILTCRVQIWENNADGKTYGCSYEWCREGVEPNIHFRQNLPAQYAQPWLDVLLAENMICASDIYSLSPGIHKMLERDGVKSILVLPLSIFGNYFGFIAFHVCTFNKEWEKSEVELLTNISQVFSNVIRRRQVENVLRLSQQTMRTVLDNITAFVFVLDIETSEILFANESLKKVAGNEIEGKMCWQVMQRDRDGVCDFCPRKKMTDLSNLSSETCRWEHFNELFGMYMAYDMVVVEWIDGRFAQLVIATDITAMKRVEQELVMERDRICAIGDNFPDGSLFRYEINPKTMKMHFTYLSATWEEVMGITIEETLADASRAFDILYPEYAQPLMESIQKGIDTQQRLIVETKNHYKGYGVKWMLVSSQPKIITDDKVIFDGFVLDITRRKETEIELEKYRENLELLVKERTEELVVAYEEVQANNEEMQSTNEELQATSEELHSTNEEMRATNEELDRYKTQLEGMVDEKTAELIIQQRELRKLNRRQEVFIKVMQILQLEEDVPGGMNMVLDLIGRYTRVDRVQIWENNADGITYGCSYEWCGKGIDPVIHFCRNLPLEDAGPWFDEINAKGMICTSDVYSLSKPIYEMLERQYVKAIVVLPMSILGAQFGFITFTVCYDKKWDEKEVELLTNIAQVFSNVIRRRQVEAVVNLSQQTMQTVLDNINAQILVSEFDTYKILFANNHFRQETDEDLEGVLCWRARKSGAPCKHCHRGVLRDSHGLPTGIHHWEHYNRTTKRWYIVMGTAIKWVNGQLAVMELATDITDRKLNEIELIRAREKAEESDKLKSAFLANMSHEIRTPINGIVGFLHFIASDDLAPERKENYVSIIKNSAGQLVQLIDDIIDVSKIEAKQMTIFPVPVDVNQLMIESQILYENNLQTRNKTHVMLIYDDSGSLDKCIAIVDPVRLRQVLNNLIVNAIKYTDKGYIRFGYRQSTPDQLEFVVEDTGIGMADNQHDLIFERFRQAENHFNEGTGLGLNIAKSLVNMMGGEIWVESGEGAGSTFYFTISYLPVAK